MKTVDRLEELLALKDEELDALREKLAAYEEPREWRWTQHTEYEPEDDIPGLPVPRLQLTCKNLYDEDNWSVQQWYYGLVYQHFVGHMVYVPLGESRRTGGSMRPPGMDDLPRMGTDMKHDAAKLNLPAFCIINGKVTQVEPLKS